MGEGAEAPGHPGRPREPEAERGDLRSWQPRAGDPPRRAPDVWRAGRAEGPAGLVYRHEAGGAPARPGDRARRARRLYDADVRGHDGAAGRPPRAPGHRAPPPHPRQGGGGAPAEAPVPPSEPPHPPPQGPPYAPGPLLPPPPAPP